MVPPKLLGQSARRAAGTFGASSYARVALPPSDHGEAQKHHVTDAAALDPHDKLPASIRRTQNAIRTVLVRQPVPAANRHQGIIALAGKLAHCCGAATVRKGPYGERHQSRP